MNEKQLQWIESNLDLHNFQVDQLTVMPGIKWKPRHRKFIRDDLVAWIIPKDALSSCFSTQGIT